MRLQREALLIMAPFSMDKGSVIRPSLAHLAYRQSKTCCELSAIMTLPATRQHCRSFSGTAVCARDFVALWWKYCAAGADTQSPLLASSDRVNEIVWKDWAAA